MMGSSATTLKLLRLCFVMHFTTPLASTTTVFSDPRGHVGNAIGEELDTLSYPKINRLSPCERQERQCKKKKKKKYKCGELLLCSREWTTPTTPCPEPEPCCCPPPPAAAAPVLPRLQDTDTDRLVAAFNKKVKDKFNSFLIKAFMDSAGAGQGGPRRMPLAPMSGGFRSAFQGMPLRDFHQQPPMGAQQFPPMASQQLSPMGSQQFPPLGSQQFSPMGAPQQPPMAPQQQMPLMPAQRQPPSMAAQQQPPMAAQQQPPMVGNQQQPQMVAGNQQQPPAAGNNQQLLLMDAPRQPYARQNRQRQQVGWHQGQHQQGQQYPAHYQQPMTLMGAPRRQHPPPAAAVQGGMHQLEIPHMQDQQLMTYHHEPVTLMDAPRTTQATTITQDTTTTTTSTEPPQTVPPDLQWLAALDTGKLPQDRDDFEMHMLRVAGNPFKPEQVMVPQLQIADKFNTLPKGVAAQRSPLGMHNILGHSGRTASRIGQAFMG